MLVRLTLFLLILLSASFSTAKARDRLAGPIPATVERVIDGDTIVVRARIWLDMEITTHVRIADIDTPELRRPGCPAERAKAEEAKALVERLIGPGAVTLFDVHHGKYAGRVVARVETREGDVAAAITDAGLSDGTWCG